MPLGASDQSGADTGRRSDLMRAVTARPRIEEPVKPSEWAAGVVRSREVRVATQAGEIADLKTLGREQQILTGWELKAMLKKAVSPTEQEISTLLAASAVREKMKPKEVGVAGGAEKQESEKVPYKVYTVDYGVADKPVQISEVMWPDAGRPLEDLELPERPEPGSMLAVQDKDSEHGYRIYVVHTTPDKATPGMTDDMLKKGLFVMRESWGDVVDVLDEAGGIKERIGVEGEGGPKVYKIEVPVKAAEGATISPGTAL